jgi:hypothetical protein
MFEHFCFNGWLCMLYVCALCVCAMEHTLILFWIVCSTFFSLDSLPLHYLTSTGHLSLPILPLFPERHGLPDTTWVLQCLFQSLPVVSVLIDRIPFQCFFTYSGLSLSHCDFGPVFVLLSLLLSSSTHRCQDCPCSSQRFAAGSCSVIFYLQVT